MTGHQPVARYWLPVFVAGSGSQNVNTEMGQRSGEENEQRVTSNGQSLSILA
jgi:hypothetical protein